ncbi:MAG: aldo/keto reductase, partial [Mycobacteriales bacterium]
MDNTPLRLGRSFSPVGLGAWQLGADWGDVDDSVARDTVNAALDAGVDFIDTADVYGDGRSERLIGEVLAQRDDADGVFVATKMGRRAPLEPEHYTLDNFRRWTDRSRTNLGVDRLDLVQLHTPPTAVFGDDRTWDALDTLVAEQRIAAYGVSVETVEEGLTAITRPGTASVQVIVNMFRQKPIEHLLPAAAAAGVAIIARIPLASGLLSGKYDA